MELRLLVLIILVIYFTIGLIISLRKKKVSDIISIRESLLLTGFPIITLRSNGKLLNFLLDTGANYSAIHKDIVNDTDFTVSEQAGSCTGLTGSIENCDYVELHLSYKDTKMTAFSQVLDLSHVINTIKDSSGVTIHGILGNCFFQDYRYVLDFDKLAVYSKI